MKTDILTPKDLFQKEVRYTIPTFQRPYVWSQDNQWEPLWEDVRNVAENYLEELERSNSAVEAEEQTKTHFMGAVVLQQISTATKDIEQREVIDGQQRVTTLQLLLDAIQGVCEEKKFKVIARRLSKLVINDKESIGDDSHHIFKLWPTKSDREAFRHAMDNGLAAKGFEESLIVQAHEFFQLQVRKWVDDNVDQVERRMDALEVAVTSMLQMVVIDLNTQDDPNVIFETLNARGTPLEQSDLIKNFVLSESRKDDMWGNLGDDWWRKEVRQGRLYRPRLDMLFNYWLAMRTNSEIAPSRVFDRFRTYVGEHQLSDVMEGVKRDLAYYKDYETNEGRTQEEKTFYYRMNVMQARVITPVLLLLLSIEHEIRIRAFRALESFMVRRMICRQTTKDYNHLALELATKLQKDDSKRANIIVSDFLKEQTAYSRRWTSNQELVDFLESAPVYRLLTRGRLRLVLEGIEGLLRHSPKSEQPDVPKRLTIEHLMPQGWEGKWPLPADVEEMKAKYDRDMLIHSIGNLTLANNKLNSSMSNEPWEKKRDELNSHSTLLLNGELISESHWDEESIRARSRRMAELISKCWPGPDSQIWES